MKRIFLTTAVLAFLFCLAAGQTEAKSYVSKSFEDKYQRMGDREANSMMRRMGIAEGGEFTLSDFKNLRLSRREEKEIRAAKKNGTYKSQEEQFREMDTNRDGKVNRDELLAYYARQAYQEEPSRRDRSSDVAKYGEPLPELTPEQKAQHDEMIAKAVASEEEIKEINENPALTFREKEEKIKEVMEKYYPEPKEEAETAADEENGAADNGGIVPEEGSEAAVAEAESVNDETAGEIPENGEEEDVL